MKLPTIKIKDVNINIPQTIWGFTWIAVALLVGNAWWLLPAVFIHLEGSKDE